MLKATETCENNKEYFSEDSGRGNRNRNDKQLELNACMLAPTPLVSDVPNRCQEDVPYGYNKNEVDH